MNNIQQFHIVTTPPPCSLTAAPGAARPESDHLHNNQPRGKDRPNPSNRRPGLWARIPAFPFLAMALVLLAATAFDAQAQSDTTAPTLVSIERTITDIPDNRIYDGDLGFRLTFSEPVRELDYLNEIIVWGFKGAATSESHISAYFSQADDITAGDTVTMSGPFEFSRVWILTADVFARHDAAYYREVGIALRTGRDIEDMAGNDLVVADAAPMPNEKYALVRGLETPTENNTAPLAVFAPPPTVERSTNPFTVQLLFDEPVTGFDPAEDLTLSNDAELMSYEPTEPDGSLWTLMIRATERNMEGELMPVTVTLEQNAIMDTSTPNQGLAAALSQEFQFADDVVEIGTGQASAVADYLQRRGAHIMAARPDLIGLLDGSGIGASSLNFNDDAWGFEFSASGREMADLWGNPRLSLDETDPAQARGDYWVSIRGIRADSGDNRDDFYSLSVGAHRRLDENRIVGGFVAIDQMDSDLRLPGATTDGTLEGGGWLAGPYLVGRMADRGLYYEAHAAWGQSTNEFSEDGSTEDEFDTDRYLVGGSLKGEYEMQGWTLRPVLSADWFREEQEAYRNASGREMEEQSITLGEVRAGPEFGRVVAMDNGGDLSVDVGVYGVASLAVDADDSEPETFDDGDFRGRVKVDLGYVRTAASAAEVGLGLYYDGIGQTGYESYGVDLRVRVAF